MRKTIPEGFHTNAQVENSAVLFGSRYTIIPRSPKSAAGFCSTFPNGFSPFWILTWRWKRKKNVQIL